MNWKVHLCMKRFFLNDKTKHFDPIRIKYDIAIYFEPNKTNKTKWDLKIMEWTYQVIQALAGAFFFAGLLGLVVDFGFGDILGLLNLINVWRFG